MHNFLKEIFRPDDKPRQRVVNRVVSGRVKIQGAVNELERIIGGIIEDNQRLTQGPQKDENHQFE